MNLCFCPQPPAVFNLSVYPHSLFAPSTPLSVLNPSSCSQPLCLSSICLPALNLSVCLQIVFLLSTPLSVLKLSSCCQPLCLPSICLPALNHSVCPQSVSLFSISPLVLDISLCTQPLLNLSLGPEPLFPLRSSAEWPWDDAFAEMKAPSSEKHQQSKVPSLKPTAGRNVVSPSAKKKNNNNKKSLPNICNEAKCLEM